MYCLTVLAVLLHLAVMMTNAKIPIVAKVTTIKCAVINKELFNISECSIKPINRNKTIINFTGYLFRTAYNIEGRLKLMKKFNVYKPFLVDVREDFCHMLSSKSGMTYSRILYKLAEPYTSMNHSCPYTGQIKFKDMELNLAKVRDAWPPGEYRLDIMGYFNKMLTMTSQLEFKFEEKYLIG